jgi:hypothetical protein
MILLMFFLSHFALYVIIYLPRTFLSNDRLAEQQRNISMKRTVEEVIKILEDHKSELQERYNVKEIGIVGFYIRHEQRETSDIDILVDFNDTPTLIKFINLENYLFDLLDVKVDLVMKRTENINFNDFFAMMI